MMVDWLMDGWYLKLTAFFKLGAVVSGFICELAIHFRESVAYVFTTITVRTSLSGPLGERVEEGDWSGLSTIYRSHDELYLHVCILHHIHTMYYIQHPTYPTTKPNHIAPETRNPRNKPTHLIKKTRS